MHLVLTLKDHAVFSLCLRFKTPHFNLETTLFSPLYGSVLSLQTLEPLFYWTATECDHIYSGCSEVRKESAGQMWGLGKAFGEILLSSFDEKGASHLFNAWNPATWNSYCIQANSQAKTFQAVLNNVKIFESLEYEGQHRKASTSMYLLNNWYYDAPLLGSISDLHIWNTNLTQKGS